MSSTYYCTPEGYQMLADKVNELKNKERPLILETMAEATKGSGSDLSENTEYIQANDALDRLDAKLIEIERKMQNSKIIDIKTVKETGRVVFGSTVEIYDCDNDENLIYKIVGEDESNIKEKKISLFSPLAKALIGSSIGDEIDVTTPTGDRLLEIIDIKHI